ncbi:MAG: class I SAM-dependent methyltransferase [Syntrophales bacterium]
MVQRRHPGEKTEGRQEDAVPCIIESDRPPAAYRKNWARLIQTPDRAAIAARRHYDLGNDLFFSFLDPCNQYSCAYFQGTDDLTEAQRKKLDLICRKIDLQSKDHLLDIGCGWGGYARYAAEHYGCAVMAVNLSEGQVRYAREFCKNLPVKILRADHRQIEGSFDKVISVGMFEHVGKKNYKTFMKVVHRCLKEDGIFLLHTIGCNTPRDSVTAVNSISVIIPKFLDSALFLR